MTNGIMKIKEGYLKDAERESEEITRDNYNILKQKINGVVTSSCIGIEKYMNILIEEMKAILAIEKSLIDIESNGHVIDDIPNGKNPINEDVLAKYDNALKESEEKDEDLFPKKEKSRNIKLKYSMLGGLGVAYIKLQEEMDKTEHSILLQKCDEAIGKLNIVLPDSLASLLRKDREYVIKILDFLKEKKLLTNKNEIDFGIIYAKYIITKLQYNLLKEELQKLSTGDKTIKQLRKLTLQLDGIMIVDMEVEDRKTGRKIGESSSNSDLLSEIEPVEWKEVIGQTDAKKVIRDSVVRFLGTYDHTTKKSIFENVIGTNPPKAVLLFGPPGTGKTYILKAAITEAEKIRAKLIEEGKLNPSLAGKNKRIHFNIITPDQIKDKYIGESSKAIKAVFEQSKKEAPSLLVIDELDAFFSSRGDSGFNEGEREIVSILMQELDGIKKSNGYILVGITNMPKSVDKAILSRFDKKIEFTKPKTSKEVTDLFKVYLKNLLGNGAIPKLKQNDWTLLGESGYALGFTGRLVKQFVKSLEQERNDILTQLYKDNENIIKEYYKDPKKMKDKLNNKSKKFTVSYIRERMGEFAAHTKHSETYSL